MSFARAARLPGILLLACLVLSTGCTDKHPKLAAVAPPVVEVALPIERTVTDYKVFTARTQAVQSVEIKARVTGYLTKILFKDGDEVQADAVLFQIDDRPYKAALDQATAAVVAAKAALVKAQADYDIGLDVKKKSSGAISEQEIVKRLGSRDEARANVSQAEASLELAKLNLGWCQVTAPFNGRSNAHAVDVGGLVSQNVTTLTNIVSLKPTWAYIDVDENTVLGIRRLVDEGKIASASKSAIPVQMGLANDSGYPFTGVVDFVANQLDPNTGSIRARAVFPNDDGALVAGLFGRLRVPVAPAHKALLIADQAVGTNQGQPFILIVNDKNEVEAHPVDVGQVFDGLREVMRYRTVVEPDAAGKDVSKQVEVLTPTDQVIVDGLQRARPGTKVEPRRVNMLTRLPVAKAGAAESK
jgi:RND family efflux transporter MFP subunit